MKKAWSKLDYLKIGMIPLLGGILYVVLPRNEIGPGATASKAKILSDTVTSPKSKPSEHSVASEPVSTKKWPAFALGEFENVDPFDRRRIFPDLSPKAPISDSVVSGFPSLVDAPGVPPKNSFTPIKIQAVFQSPKGIAALVGERVIHVGDRLEDGTEVIDITPEQLIVAPMSVY
ncbi:MAG: hypothetical protein NTY15_10620 [Planctomycetota bacterium]|jgi:hypothetical protein|nr:hypothetical protein [Planctomycetota bacterium]